MSCSHFCTLGFCRSALAFLLEREALVNFQDHEHTCAEQVDFQVLNSGVLDALRDLGPDLFVVFLVFSNQGWIVLKVEYEAEAASHDSSAI
jgi:hypothetical protein